MTQRDWNEPEPGMDPVSIKRILNAVVDIENGRAPETQWEVDHYTAALKAGFASRPLPSKN